MNEIQIDAVAQTLIRARREQRCADAQAFATALATPEEAYAVQAAVAGSLGWHAAGPGYWKSGGPSRQARLTHAQLPADGVWSSPAMAGDRHFTWRGIEAEIALRLARPVSPEDAAALDGDSAATLVDAMAVSIEVVDSRWQQFTDAPALLKLADLQAHGALVLGEWRPYEARDWAAQRCHVRIGAQSFERKGTHALGDPAYGLGAWLRHATSHGQRVEAGTVVTTGTWVGILPAAAGDLVTAEFDGIGHASIQF
ncbi:fumarylacetoacetate hydrolase family protein [Cupriavidus sp. WKF15]|uniref:fumarylacetoacetate hydrolase family protein n=1 Tax=Cupriavidus sp. WKF15 TaxID=3032282 RepID=UPI0023E09B9B|nr:fumarylacetoacetate hydrolase family protein [Cupriavidus sp. WKF15]WER48790.1 fumarylacetoacetate hydrolase family protein [Cupriavidus sp. WKF15]